jgi:hypothetical protein
MALKPMFSCPALGGDKSGMIAPSSALGGAVALLGWCSGLAWALQ